MIPRRNRDEIPARKGTLRSGSDTYQHTRDKTKSEKRKGEKRGVQGEEEEEKEEEEGRDRMINRFSQYLSRDHGNFSNIVPSIPSDNGISILPADKRSISPFGPHRSRQFQPAASTILFPKKDLLLWEDGTTSTSREVKFLFSCVFDFGN